MNVTVAAVALAPGLAVGSFLNVVASRVPLRLPIGTSRSRCMSCAHEIAARDNVPLLSYLLLQGRCRNCSARIPMRYPAVESVTALMGFLCVLRFGATLDALIAAFFCAVLVAIATIDIEHRSVPNRVVLPAAVIVLGAQTIVHWSLEWTIAALAASLFLFLVALAYPYGLGMGDVKLALLLGAMLGRNVTVALMLGAVAALVPAAVLIARHGSKARKLAIPLAPFLALGALVSLFGGNAILDWYLSLTS